MTRNDLLALPPTIPLMTSARALGIGRTQAYEMARTDTYPIRLLKIGKRYRVITAELLDLLRIQQPGIPAAADSDSAAVA